MYVRKDEIVTVLEFDGQWESANKIAKALPDYRVVLSHASDVVPHHEQKRSGCPYLLISTNDLDPIDRNINMEKGEVIVILSVFEKDPPFHTPSRVKDHSGFMEGPMDKIGYDRRTKKIFQIMTKDEFHEHYQEVGITEDEIRKIVREEILLQDNAIKQAKSEIGNKRGIN